MDAKPPEELWPEVLGLLDDMRRELHSEDRYRRLLAAIRKLRQAEAEIPPAVLDWAKKEKVAGRTIKPAEADAYDRCAKATGYHPSQKAMRAVVNLVYKRNRGRPPRL
jgi:hypothetical protein